MRGWKKAIGILIAMNLVGCGVGLFLQCGLGSDPIGILCDGLSRALQIRFGHASLLYNLAVIALAALFARKNLGAGTIVYALCSGYFIDFYSWLFSPLQFGTLPIAGRLGLFLAGEFFFGLALALLIYFGLGMNALDAVLYQLEHVSGIRYAILRMMTDALYTATGFALGGVFGIGTAAAVFLTGNLVSRLLKLLQVLEKRYGKGNEYCANATQ